jgi:HEAT repeat protein
MEDNWDERLKSIEEAWKLDEPTAINSLINGLKDMNSSIRMKAAEALANHSGDQSEDALVKALGDNESRVADQAMMSLLQIGESAVDNLISALKEDNSTVKENAAQVLGRIGDSRAIEHLRRLQTESNDSDVQNSTAYALRKLNWKTHGTA